MIAVFLIGAAAVLLLSGFLYEKNWFRSLSIRVLFSCPHVCAREPFELTEIIENRKKMALPVVEIGFRLPRGLHFDDAENILESDYVYKRDLFAVRGMERIIRRYHVTALKRGYYTVSQLTCQAPSRLFRSTYRLDAGTPEGMSGLYVYAARADCSVLLRPVEVILGELECARRLYEDPFTFSSIRPYTVQDPMKSINWKAAAKTGQLMVNTFASAAAVRVRIFLDVSADPGVPFSDSFRELGIAMAASLIRALVKEQRDASLMVNCRKESGMESIAGHSETEAPCVTFPSCLSAGKLTAVEEFLTADFDACSLLTFEDMLHQAAQGKSGFGMASGPEDEVYVFLTSADRSSLRAQIHKLLGVQHSGILAVLCRTADRRREEKERRLYILPVCETQLTDPRLL